MSEKMNKEVFLSLFKKIYPNNNIIILEWNGFTKDIKYVCDKCHQIHSYADARQLFIKQSYCYNVFKAGKFSFLEYQTRINNIHEEQIEIIEYTGLSNKVKYYCPCCRKVKSCNPARNLITRLSLCDECYGVEKNKIREKLNEKFKSFSEYKLITWRGCNKKMTIYHTKCNSYYDRWPKAALDYFNNCPFCNSGAIRQRLPMEEMQRRIDKEFGRNSYQLLNYTGQLQKNNKIKCLSCGLIFNTQFSTFVNSRGCPKCKRFKSKGEKRVQKFLEDNNIRFESQKRFSDCNNNLSSFDFCVYDKNNIMHLIEVNGAQHYYENKMFDGLNIIQRRDKIKMDYCKNNNIDLIIIPYSKISYKSIEEQLSFLKGSTTIPCGSKE